LNILHINDKITISGGVEVYIKQLLELSPSYGIKALWLGINTSTGFFNLKSWSTKIENKQKLSFNELFKYLTKFISNNKIEIIHVHSLSSPKLIELCLKLAPVVRTMHEPRMICPGQGKFLRKSEQICKKPYGLHCFYHAYKEGCCNRHPKRLLKAYNNVNFETKIASIKYAAIFVMSDYILDEALKVGYNKNKLFLNPCFTPTIIKEVIIDCINDELKSIVYIGRLSRTKGVHYAIKSVITLLKQGYKVQFDIVGAGHDENYFKSLVPKQYKSQFIFHGWQDRVTVDLILNKAYVVLFPSIYPEAFGITGIEAMMRAKPVVGFNVGGVSTWLKNNETGFLVEQKNYTEMANKVARLIDDVFLYKHFSTISRDIAISEFSEEKHLNLLKTAYKKILFHESRSSI
jgi:glycosyltransferase involved in cell wall biosynthesis